MIDILKDSIDYLSVPTISFTLSTILFPFIAMIFMAVHFWRIRKDGGISGPL